MLHRRHTIRNIIIAASVLLFALPVFAHDITVQFGWGAGREIAYRTAVTIDPLLEAELFALLKDTAPGQHIRLSTPVYTGDRLHLTAGVSLWHQNNTGRIDDVSAWLKASAAAGPIRFRAQWTKLDSWHYGLDVIIPAKNLLGIETLARTALSVEFGPPFSGFMSGLIVNW